MRINNNYESNEAIKEQYEYRWFIIYIFTNINYLLRIHIKYYHINDLNNIQHIALINVFFIKIFCCKQLYFYHIMQHGALMTYYLQCLFY